MASIRSVLIQKRMLSVLLLIAALLSAVLPSPVSAAEEEKGTVVRVGYYQNENFQTGSSDEEVKSGYGYEYLRKVAYYSGWKYEYVYGSWSDLYEQFLNGQIDVMAGISRTEEREETILFPQYEMGNESYYLYKHNTDRTISVDSLETLSSKKIGVVKNTIMVSFLQEWIAQNEIEATIVEYDGFDDQKEAFDCYEIDCCVSTDNSVSLGDGWAGVVKIGELPYYLAVTKERSDLLEELNAALIKLNGVEPYFLLKLQYNYFGDSVINNMFTDEEQEWISSHSVLKVGYFKSYMPYSGTDEDGNATGLMTDVLEEILNKLEIQDQISVSYTAYDDYEDMVDDLHSGRIDAVFPVGGELWNAEQDGIFASSPVVSAGVDLAFAGGYDDDTTASIAVNRHNRMQYYYTTTNFPDARVVYCDSVKECLDAVLYGKAGSTILNGIRTNSLLSDAKYSTMVSMQLSRSDDFCFGVADGNDDLLLILNRGIRTIGEDYGTNASHKYMTYQYTVSDFVREHATSIVLFVFCVASLIILLLVRDTVRGRHYSAEIEKSRNQLADALKAAEEASHAKTTFLFNMSHDIRTPMNAIIGFTELLDKNGDDPECRKDYIHKIKISSEFLLALINNVLEMSRIESGKLVLDETLWSVEQFHDMLYSVFYEQMRAKGITFTRETYVTHQYIYCDTIKLREIFHNILSNAYKYTPAGGSVTMVLRELPSGIEGVSRFRTEITDTGIGMSKEFLPQLFDEFTRERTSTESKVGGTGLGMAIVKRLVDIMDGDIEVESELGKGTRFIVTIPHRVADEAQIPTPTVSGVDSAVFEGKRILLAEDNDLNAEIAEEILQQAGFETERAEDGVKCVEMVEKAEVGYYDLILMDIQMPRMNGYEATRAVRALSDPQKAGIPIFAMTANAFEEDKKEALKAGMNGHMAKPIDVKELMRTLSAALKKAEEQTRRIEKPVKSMI